MCKLKQNNAITLIALVITIIVLLILAGVSLRLVMGENGILGKAVHSKEVMEEAQSDEQLRLKYMEAMATEPWNGSVASEFANGTGTESDPFIIQNGEQLAYLANQVNSGNAFEDKYISITESINLGNKEFTPIGLGNEGRMSDDENWTSTNKFQGKLNGNNNVITGLKITQLNKSGVGLIGVLETGGEVKNLIISEGTIVGLQSVGGIVGASRGNIINCQNSANIEARSNSISNTGDKAGGIIGQCSAGNIENCRNYGKVITNNIANSKYSGKVAGGIIGIAGYSKENEEINIENCKNNGTVTTDYQQAGGIIGGIWSVKEVSITNCSNSGTITSERSFSGGIVGDINDGSNSIIDCSNSGTITANETSGGGIVGFIKDGSNSIIDCKNSGIITMNEASGGGIVGDIRSGSNNIKDCKNSGTVTTGNRLAGGIVGAVNDGDNNIKDCSNSGTIESKSQGKNGKAGGIIGGIALGNIENVYNSGNVKVGNYTEGETGSKNIDSVGGIVGWLKDGKISKAYNRGEIQQDNVGEEDFAGGIVAKKDAGIVEESYYYSTDTTLKGIGNEEGSENYKIDKIYNSLDEFKKAYNITD